MDSAARNGMGSRFARVWREKGPKRALGQALRMVCRPVLEVGSVRFFTARGDVVEAAPERGDIQIGEATREAVADVTMDREGPWAEAEIERRFERGDRCITAREASGRCLHARWLTDKPTHIPELDLYVVPAPGELYMYDGYTRGDARGRGIDKLVRRYVLAQSWREGVERVISYVHGANTPGLKAAGKLQRETGAVIYITLLCRWRLRRRSRQCPELVPRRELERRLRERQEREGALNQWFQSWLSQPMEKRSTGFSALPDAYFQSAASHIIETLALEPERDAVLDVGCSSGPISRLVAPYTRRFAGVDATPGLIADIVADTVRTASGEAATFSVADGRQLPYGDNSFDKVYCSGVIHMLPSTGDALRMVDEMLRVCRPGGIVMLGAVPDADKKAAGRRLVWRRAPPLGKARLLAARLVPRPLRRGLQRIGLVKRNPIAFLEFDMAALKARYEARGLACQLLDYPSDYWSEDFRTSRSNLLLALPVAAPRAAPATEAPERSAAVAAAAVYCRTGAGQGM